MNSKVQITVFFIPLLLVVSSCSLFDPAGNLNIPPQSRYEIIVESIDFNIQKRGSQSEWQYCNPQDVDLSRFNNVIQLYLHRI